MHSSLSKVEKEYDIGLKKDTVWIAYKQYKDNGGLMATKKLGLSILQTFHALHDVTMKKMENGDNHLTVLYNFAILSEEKQALFDFESGIKSINGDTMRKLALS